MSHKLLQLHQIYTVFDGVRGEGVPHGVGECLDLGALLDPLKVAVDCRDCPRPTIRVAKHRAFRIFEREPAADFVGFLRQIDSPSFAGLFSAFAFVQVERPCRWILCQVTRFDVPGFLRATACFAQHRQQVQKALAAPPLTVCLHVFEDRVKLLGCNIRSIATGSSSRLFEVSDRVVLDVALLPAPIKSPFQAGDGPVAAAWSAVSIGLFDPASDVQVAEVHDSQQLVALAEALAMLLVKLVRRRLRVSLSPVQKLGYQVSYECGGVLDEIVGFAFACAQLFPNVVRYCFVLIEPYRFAIVVVLPRLVTLLVIGFGLAHRGSSDS
jgi:hypothetical protein